MCLVLLQFERLQQQAKAVKDQLDAGVVLKQSVEATLNPADQLELQGRLQTLLDGYGRVTLGIDDRNRTLQGLIQQQRDIGAKVEESVDFLNKIQEDVRALNKPVGCRPEDAQATLNSYENLLAELRRYRDKLDDLQHRTSGNSGDLALIIKQQDDLIASIEQQVKKLRQLLLLRQQFMALVGEIMNFVAKYSEVVHDIEKGGRTAQEKIRRYDDVVYKIQECEALLATANDKGDQIAAEGSVSDRNSIAEQLTSLKQQLNSLRRTVEKRRGEHETAAAEYKRLSAELDALVDKLQQREGTVRCRPLLDLMAESVEHERCQHQALAAQVADLLAACAALLGVMPRDGVIPSTLQERISEATFLRDTLPAELAARGAYIDQQLDLRTTYDSLVRRLNAWLDEANTKLRPSSGGVDLEHVDRELEEHVAFFNGSSSAQSLLDGVRCAADQLWQSVDGQQQQVMTSELNALSESVKRCLAASDDRQDQLEKDLRAVTEYARLLDQNRQLAACRAQWNEEVATNVPALKALVANLESQLSLLQVLGRLYCHLLACANSDQYHFPRYSMTIRTTTSNWNCCS